MPTRQQPSARFPFLVAAAVVAASATSLAAQAAEPTGAAIDAQVWTAISTTVVEHDIKGMAAAYHPDAVVVTPKTTTPVAKALAGWGQGMEAMKKNGSRASVAFRFAQRLDGAETAFESGMFNYAVTDSAGATTRYIIPFEALLVRRDGRWRILMERQMPASDEAAWTAMAP